MTEFSWLHAIHPADACVADERERERCIMCLFVLSGFRPTLKILQLCLAESFHLNDARVQVDNTDELSEVKVAALTIW